MLLLALLIAPLITAQGIYPCTSTVNPATANQSVCDALNAPGLTPIASTCTSVTSAAGSAFFCGFAGSTCRQPSECDFGSCSVTDPTSTTPGVCVGGFADVCTTTKMCLGNLACGVSPAGTTGQATCGGVGASCTNDGITPVLANCAPGLSCSSATLICVSTSTSTSVSNGVSPSLPVPSAKLRRRSLSSARRHLCPLGYSKCPVSAFSSNILSSAAHTGRNTFGHAPHGSVWKCLNTASSLESCGGCPSLDATSPFHHLRSSKQNATREGVDCTTLPGVQGVECINSKCVVEACEAGWKFAMDEGGVGSCSL